VLPAPQVFPDKVTFDYLESVTPIQLVLATRGSSSGSYTPVSVLTLSHTPIDYNYNLVFPQQFFPLLDLQPPAPFTDMPFFYADAQRTYFVTESFLRPWRQLDYPSSVI